MIISERGIISKGCIWHDARVGRWGSVEPQMDKYPGVSPYCYAFNNPMVLKDEEGKDSIVTIEGNTIRFDGYMIFKINKECDNFQFLLNDVFLLHISVIFVKELKEIFNYDVFFYYNGSVIEFQEQPHDVAIAMRKHMLVFSGKYHISLINIDFFLDSLLKYLPHPVIFNNEDNLVYLIFKISTSAIELKYTANQFVCNDESDVLPIEQGKFLFPFNSDYSIERLELHKIESLCKPYYIDEKFWNRINSQVMDINENHVK